MTLGVLDLCQNGLQLFADLFYCEMLIGHIFDFHGNLLLRTVYTHHIIQWMHKKYNCFDWFLLKNRVDFLVICVYAENISAI